MADNNVSSNASRKLSSVDGRALLLAMAFGQGAGTMLATSEALEVALEKYTRLVRADAKTWNQNVLRAIEYARAIGAVAATAATSNRRFLIDRTDVESAVEAVPTQSPDFLTGCNC